MKAGWIAVATMLFAACSMEPGNVYHVSLDGNDDDPGTLWKPFRTIEKARDAIRARRAKGDAPPGGFTVEIAAGIHVLEKPLVLEEQDGGTAESPVVYRARSGERVQLWGCREVRGFRPVTDKAVRERLDESARGRVLMADLKAEGITEFGELSVGALRGGPMLELYFNGEAMPMSRWPNEGFANYGKVLDKGSIPRWKEKPERPAKIEYTGNRPARWTNAPEIYLHGYWCHDWYDDVLKVASLDTEKKEVLFTGPHMYGVEPNRRYAALNLLEEIDKPGEWMLDRAGGVLYFWPPRSLEKAVITVSMIEEPLVQIEKASFVTLQDLIVEMGRGMAILVKGGTNNLVAGCTVRNMGTSAIQIRPAEEKSEGAVRIEAGDPVVDGRENGVAGCDIYEIGTSGILLLGGDRRTLAPAKHFAVNNDIHHYSRRKRTNCPAITLTGVGNRIANNRIHDAPHCGVFYHGNDHVLELNEVYRLAWETGDVGAFYSGREWTYRGNVIRNNFFHDIKAPGKYGSMTVYLDDSHSSTAIIGNVFVRTQRSAFIGGGRDNLVENNIFVDAETAVWLDNRSETWGHKYQSPGGDHRMYGKLKDVRHDQPPYSERYPKLATILKEEPHKPLGNVARNNLAVRCGKWFDGPKGCKEYMTFADNTVTDEDPGFANPEALDYSLPADAAIYKQNPNLKPIPFEKIGLFLGNFRRAIPPR